MSRHDDLQQLKALAQRRSLYTGEQHQRATDALKQLPAGTPPIPQAARPEQAFLETLILHRVRGRFGIVSEFPLGIVRVTPKPDKLVITLDPQPFVVRAWADHLLPLDSNEPDEIRGVAGLRYHVARHHVDLYLDHGNHRARVVLQGFPVRWWEQVARAIGGTRSHTACWLLPDGHRTDNEQRDHQYETKWPGRDDRLGSDLLRRIGLTRFEHGYGGTEVWSDPNEDGCSWRLELLSGPDDTWLFNHLCDPHFGLPLRVAWHSCPDRRGCMARLVSTTQPTQTVNFTNLHWTPDSDENEKRAARQANYNVTAFDTFQPC